MQARLQPLRILARPALSSAVKNPYTRLLYAPLIAAGHTVAEYRLDRALLGRWDVVHVHWPESVFNHTLPEALITTESLLAGLHWARKRGAKVLWTIHNLRAHERRHPAWEQKFRSRYLSELDGIVALSASGLQAARQTYPSLEALPAWTVPHPHYRGRYDDSVDRRQARQQLGLPQAGPVLLSFGRVFEYKNIPALLRAVETVPDKALTVLVAGKPRDPELAHQLRQAGRCDPRIRLDLDFIAPERVQLYFRAATLTVLPYREILNSGTAVLSLSFDRPVLLPKQGAGSELSQQLGLPWVHTFNDELDADDLRGALARVDELPERTQGQHLDFCSPTTVSARMLEVLEELIHQ